MKRFSWQISSYIIKTILPYFAFAWLLLSVILFIQQASRYADIFFNNSIPTSLIWQLTFALVPTVISFTCPMAVLVGVIIGLSKMQGDSELVAIRTAGIGNFQITLPLAILGILLSLFAFFINDSGVPFAARIVRRVAIQATVNKLDSPVEPGIFNTEIQDSTIFVRDGDVQSGSWKNIFIFNEDKKAGQMRLITSENGRIDSTGDDSELVLGKATVITFSNNDAKGNLVSESVENLRVIIKTKRGELINKLSKTETSIEELGLGELQKYAENKSGKERLEAEILWRRKAVLSVAPLLFALLGTSLVLRFNRGGKGVGILLALVSLAGYYSATLLGEQLARTGQANVIVSSLLPVFLTVLLIFWLFLSQRLFLAKSSDYIFKNFKPSFPSAFRRRTETKFFASFTTRILDFDIIADLIRYFLLTQVFFTAIYLIFTALELWKFAGTIENGVFLLNKYLLFLIPFIYIQISPSALMIATLATYVIKSRQNEVVTWTAAGQSMYRLLFPCFALMLLFGFINWEIQERFLPAANRMQDSLRLQIRNQGILAAREGRNWIAIEDRIFSFEIPRTSEREENEGKIGDLTIYQFTEGGANLQSITKTTEARWENNKIKLNGQTERIVLNKDNQIFKEILPRETEISENFNPFKRIYRKPSHLSAHEISEFLKTAAAESERRSYTVALEKKYSTAFLPLIITLFTAPFALSLNRKGKVVVIGYAVGMWLLFMLTTSALEQFGVNGYVSPKMAVWSPLFLFTIIGVYLLTKIRT